MSVCLQLINVKTAEPISHKFGVGPRMTPGRFVDAQCYKKLTPNYFNFRKILKSTNLTLFYR